MDTNWHRIIRLAKAVVVMNPYDRLDCCVDCGKESHQQHDKCCSIVWAITIARSVISEREEDKNLDGVEYLGRYSLLDISKLSGTSISTIRKYMKHYPKELRPVASRSHSKRFDYTFLQKVIEVKKNKASRNKS